MCIKWYKYGKFVLEEVEACKEIYRIVKDVMPTPFGTVEFIYLQNENGEILYSIHPLLFTNKPPKLNSYKFNEKEINAIKSDIHSIDMIVLGGIFWSDLLNVIPEKDIIFDV